ncbi:HAMP domain-containing histidine kinase [bacterium]|nr:HAMP domain-containing histidine kinase [bacterium]
MSRAKPLYYNVIVFIVAQLAWLSLLGLWINRFITRHLMLQQVDSNVPALSSGNSDWLVLATGCVLFIAVSVGMSLTFRNLNINLRLMNMYDNFIASITHELKSPLASLQLFLETMLENDVPPEKAEEFIRQMLKDTGRLDRLINSILEIAGLEQKKLNFTYEVYQADRVLPDLILEACANRRLTPEQISISGSAPAECVIEKKSMQILFDNLVDNAIKYSAGQPFLTAVLSQSARYVKLVFIDNGIGIPKKHHKDIFSKFYRIRTPHTPSVKGTGLGLYWVKEIIQLHGGSVEVCDCPGRSGTAFQLKLPIYRLHKKRYLENLLKRAREKVRAQGGG